MQVKPLPLPWYVKRPGEQVHVTDNYVSSPPALWIIEPNNTCWTLGENRGEAPNGEYAFEVLRDGQRTGVWASRIERRNGRIRCFTRTGWKVWSGRYFF